MTKIDAMIFNTKKEDYERPSLFLGERNGLFDTVNKHYPKIWDIYKTIKSLDWDENEVSLASCAAEFKTCDKSTYDIMLKTLAYQWEADSIASRISPVVGCLVSSSELWAAWQRLSDQEVLHAATYSEIIRNSFPDPKEVLAEVLSTEAAFGRIESVANELGRIYHHAHLFALGKMSRTDTDLYDSCFMFPVAMLCLERIQFMASFAATFAVCETGRFTPIGKLVQKICQDEWETHVELDKEVIRIERQTERGREAEERLKPRIQKLVDDVVLTELEWVDYLFSEGRSLVGLTKENLKDWVLFCAKDVYKFLDLEPIGDLPRTNPLRFMENWLDISKTQPAPQEEDVTQYKVGIIQRTDENDEFDCSF